MMIMSFWSNIVQLSLFIPGSHCLVHQQLSLLICIVCIAIYLGKKWTISKPLLLSSCAGHFGSNWSNVAQNEKKIYFLFLSLIFWPFFVLSVWAQYKQFACGNFQTRWNLHEGKAEAEIFLGKRHCSMLIIEERGEEWEVKPVTV